MALDVAQYRHKLEKLWQRVPRHLPLTRPTFCPRLWSDAFVSDRGDVYFCCHMLPFRVGNLYDAPLQEIYNKLRAREARLFALTRTLLCHDRCTLHSEEERAASTSPETAMRSP